jgi:hypothetical protein
LAGNERNKTKTIKQRAIYIYLPSLEMTQNWKNRAKQQGTSISKFVIERVEESIGREEEDGRYQSKLELVGRLEKAENELRELRDENRLLRKLVENQETELRRYRAQPFLEEEYEGVRSFDKEFIEILRRGGAHRDDAILSELNISPTDVDLVTAVRRQLEALEGYNLVEFTPSGWRWVG